MHLVVIPTVTTTEGLLNIQKKGKIDLGRIIDVHNELSNYNKNVEKIITVVKFFHESSIHLKIVDYTSME